MIKQLPLEENPREKALTYGIETLSNIELLALIIRTGNKDENVLQLSSRILNEIGGIRYFYNLNYSFLVSLKGINKAKAIELLAVMELSKRIKEITYNTQTLNDPTIVYDYLKDKMSYLNQEHFVLLCLNTKCHLIKEKTLFIGTENMSLVSVKEVFKEALQVNSSYVIVSHNHPSGESSPSDEDIKVTEMMVESGKMLGIEVLDHIIVGKNEFYSFAMNQRVKI